MFICSFIGMLKLTIDNYTNFLFSFVGISFAFSKFIDCFEFIKNREGGQKCQRSFGDFQRDAMVKTDARFLSYTVSFIRGLREERHGKTEGHRKKEEMAGLESINGPVYVFLNIRLLNSLSRRVWRALYVVYGKWVLCFF